MNGAMGVFGFPLITRASKRFFVIHTKGFIHCIDVQDTHEKLELGDLAKKMQKLEKETFLDNLTIIGFEVQARDVCRNDVKRTTDTRFPLREKRPWENQ